MLSTIEPRHYGLHALMLGSLVGQLTLWLVVSWQLHRTGITTSIESERWLSISLLLAAWGVGVLGRLPRLSDGALAIMVIALFSMSGLFGQYAAASLNRPWVDPMLARADAALGVRMPSIVAWMAVHPRVDHGLLLLYATFLPQAAFAPFLFAIVASRRALWTYVVAYQMAWTIALLCLALWPVMCPFVYFNYQMDPHLAGRVGIGDLFTVRAGEFHELQLGLANGLISFPSFHAVLGMLMIWTARERWWLFVPLLIVNTGLILGAAFLGEHYVVDILASLIGMPVVIWIAHRLTASVAPRPEHARAQLAM